MIKHLILRFESRLSLLFCLVYPLGESLTCDLRLMKLPDSLYDLYVFSVHGLNDLNKLFVMPTKLQLHRVKSLVYLVIPLEFSHLLGWLSLLLLLLLLLLRCRLLASGHHCLLLSGRSCRCCNFLGIECRQRTTTLWLRLV